MWAHACAEGAIEVANVMNWLSTPNSSKICHEGIEQSVFFHTINNTFPRALVPFTLIAASLPGDWVGSAKQVGLTELSITSKIHR